MMKKIEVAKTLKNSSTLLDAPTDEPRAITKPSTRLYRCVYDIGEQVEDVASLDLIEARRNEPEVDGDELLAKLGL